MRKQHDSVVGRTISTLALAAIAALICVGPACAAPLAAAGDHDIGALMQEADQQFDIDRQDAVILLEDRAVRIYEDGRRRTTVHRIVWMNTELGLDTYGDLRVPHRSDRATLEVHTLRTWRDDRWWPAPAEVSPIAVVETLPGAVSSADDYTDLRETMLLHDGLELPCIVETRYSITQEPPAVQVATPSKTRMTNLASYAHDGLWSFAQADPIVRAVLRITVPSGSGIQYVSRSGAGGMDASRSGHIDGDDLYLWQMDHVARIPQPHPEDLLAVTPHLVWSRWPSWDVLGGAVSATFESACRLDCQSLGRAVCDSLAAAIEREADARATAQAVRDFIDKWTRLIHVDPDFWMLQPRPALRTWEAAYGHAYDRAVLAAALFREAGLAAQPIFRSRNRGAIEGKIPALSWFDGLLLQVRARDHGGSYKAIYDPSRGTLTDSQRDLAGHTIWVPGEEPRLLEDASAGSLLLKLTLEPGEEGVWTGSGYLSARGGMAPYAEMTGLGTQAKDYLSSVAQVIEGAQLTEHNVAALQPAEIVAGFALTWDEPESDEHGRLPLTLGSPAGGLLAHLPHDVHVYDEQRGSPVLLPYPMTQRVELRIKIGEGEDEDEDGNVADEQPVYAPIASNLQNAAGRARVSIERDGAWLYLVREIEVERTAIGPELWPKLRELLLHDLSSRNQTLLLDAD